MRAAHFESDRYLCSVDDIRPWIARDIQNFKTCEVDSMLQSILAGCALDPSESLDRSALFQTCLEAVLPLCNETTGAAQDIKGLLSD